MIIERPYAMHFSCRYRMSCCVVTRSWCVCGRRTFMMRTMSRVLG